MSNETDWKKHPLLGNKCVVVTTEGKVEVKEFGADESVFNKAKEYIGCRWLDHVFVEKMTSEISIEFLVNDNGYSDWDMNPSMVNQLATYFYNGTKAPGHYILGNIVFCLTVAEEEGGDFCGMCDILASRIALSLSTIMPKAISVVPIPREVPAPKVEISSYDSLDALLADIDARRSNGKEKAKDNK